MVYLREMFVLEFYIANKTHEASALRAVQRFLQRLGYKRGKKKGCTSYHLSTKNALLHDEQALGAKVHCMDNKLLGLDILTGGKFGKLLSEMDQLQVTNALIVMDNAIFHKGCPADTPSSRMRKKRLQD
ncbi:hypothetical protein H310_08830 [Aphanomyces invadans]|uniref:Tc1-like transposase DDE domain-containing protein n=1 Tax=Aphanomyces invadans TaxID=157072 RepID=A0A024TXL3_9STRA|nr:hypothetical protein H310_08830 [Aphanomyces invadans]ETV98763.1 hypothetical protein H310_08830 [Aphanomyces invadans]|eukprot:XP_008872960.1 hypothetical protein H310_08830 [Aphanomyces invadans]